MGYFRRTAVGLTGFVALASAGVLGPLSACSSAKKAAGPCARGELQGCGAACSVTSPCPLGLSCEGNICGAECASATVARDCGSAHACSADGTCTALNTSGDASTSSGDGGTGGSLGGDGAVCADVIVDTNKLTPNVMLIIDQSGSMNDPLGGTTRWEGLRSALLADDGILNEFATSVRFGLALYSARESDPEPRVCPLVTQVPVSMGNIGEIRSVYQNAQPIADTPTGDSIDVVLDSVEKAGLLEIDVRDPTIFILATDGEPDRCEELNPQHGQDEAIASVQRAFDAGVRTYIIAVANEQDISTAHIQAMANAGAGKDNSPSYRVDNDMGLRDVLRAVINRELSCDVDLNGKVDTTMDCEGVVTLNGKPLGCKDANGYTLKGASQLTLNGDACTGLKAGGTLKAVFPCDAVVLN